VDGLPSPGACPECAAPFNLDMPSSFTRKPPLLRWKLWGPGLVLALLMCFVGTLLGGVVMKNIGYGLWIGVPIGAGAILGYGTRVGRMSLILFGLIVAAAFITGMMTMSLGGVFCAMILGGVVLVPIYFGVLLGWGLREHLKQGKFDQGPHLPMILFFLLPVVWCALEGSGRPRAVESVTTEVVVNAPADQLWNSLMFYEEVTHEPPWILKVGLARPVRTVGASQRVGDIKKCLYNKGPITKRITQVVPGRRLAFEVIDQQIGYERDLRLVGGSFEFEPLPDGRTVVRLRTDYEPRLTPRLQWRWGESIAFHTLHEYVIEGMRRKVEGGGV
jgi:hypothetical protein